MLKCASYGWRSVSIERAVLVRNVAPTACGPAVTARPQLQVLVDAFVGVVVAQPVAVRRHREHLEPLAVEGDFDLVRLAQPFDVLVAVPHQADLDFVLAVARKGVADDGAAARAERQAVDVLFLREVGGSVTTRIGRRRQPDCRSRAASLSARP